jgi:hypothetical protein
VKCFALLSMVGWYMCFGDLAAAQDPSSLSETAGTIGVVTVEISDSLPPTMTVQATAVFDSPGYMHPRLERSTHKVPPEDGFLDYDFSATTPLRPSAGGPSVMGATDRLNNVATEARWIRGIRVHGVGEGIREVTLTDEQLARIAGFREFAGVSGKGSFDEALQDALGKLNEALGDSVVADGMATWQLGPVTGTVGGFAGLNEIKLVIYATRTPPWK